MILKAWKLPATLWTPPARRYSVPSLVQDALPNAACAIQQAVSYSLPITLAAYSAAHRRVSLISPDDRKSPLQETANFASCSLGMWQMEAPESCKQYSPNTRCLSQATSTYGNRNTRARIASLHIFELLLLLRCHVRWLFIGNSESTLWPPLRAPAHLNDTLNYLYEIQRFELQSRNGASYCSSVSREINCR